MLEALVPVATMVVVALTEEALAEGVKAGRRRARHR